MRRSAALSAWRRPGGAAQRESWRGRLIQLSLSDRFPASLDPPNCPQVRKKSKSAPPSLLRVSPARPSVALLVQSRRAAECAAASTACQHLSRLPPPCRHSRLRTDPACSPQVPGGMGFFEDLIPGQDRYEVEEEVGHGSFSEARAATACRGGLWVVAPPHARRAGTKTPARGFLHTCCCCRCTVLATSRTAAPWR